MNVGHLVRGLCVAFVLLIAGHASADVQKVYVLEEIDDNHIIIVTQAGERLQLEKWSLRFSPLLFEGRYFVAEVSPRWVTIHFEDRDSIKWSIEERLETVTREPPATTQGTTRSTPSGKASGQGCYKSILREPSPFLGNGRSVRGTMLSDSNDSSWQSRVESACGSRRVLYPQAFETTREFFPGHSCGNGGEIFILGDGTVWKEVSYQFLYLYEYQPTVIVCPGEGKMILGGHVFQIVPAR